MPFAQKILYTIPTIPLGLIVVVFAVLLSIFGLMVTRRLVPHKMLNQHTDLTAAIFEAVGMAYTVILAFMVVVSWQNFDKTLTNVEGEANELVDLYRDSAAFQPEQAEKIRTGLKEYYDAVITDEWQLMEKGKESVKANDALRKVWSFYASYEPVSAKESAFFSESISNLNDLRESRRLRIMSSRTGINYVLWFILIFGGLTTICFTFFFAAENFTYNLLLVSILGAIIGLVLLTILLFDFPFTGDVKIPVDVYKQIVNF
ncbi:MAG TPA: DUF4239 domain-containing protein [Candidatus Omnitrophota bacterium]|nr:DUF4239 domain-containing protein [Candidatus Omnitrophota bacterium]